MSRAGVASPIRPPSASTRFLVILGIAKAGQGGGGRPGAPCSRRCCERVRPHTALAGVVRVCSSRPRRHGSAAAAEAHRSSAAGLHTGIGERARTDQKKKMVRWASRRRSERNTHQPVIKGINPLKIHPPRGEQYCSLSYSVFEAAG